MFQKNVLEKIKGDENSRGKESGPNIWKTNESLHPKSCPKAKFSN